MENENADDGMNFSTNKNLNGDLLRNIESEYQKIYFCLGSELTMIINIIIEIT